MAHGRDHEDPRGSPADLAAVALVLARRFAAGGTLWCWAPGAPQHAQHVAVEFVHPVIAGTRALPAVAVLDGAADATTTLRPMARAGDVLLVVAGADAPVADTLLRAQAWGLTTIWLGAGCPPDRTGADHVLWVSDDPLAFSDGHIVLGYHLLWELTHVCFEHPGLLREAVEDGAVCTTCSDEGRLGEIVACAAGEADATVRTAAGLEHVDTTMVGPVHAGDLVLVHAGTAITMVGP